MKLPADANNWWTFDPNIEAEQYVRQTLEGYRSLTTTCGGVRPADERLARSLYQKRIPLYAIEGAFILVQARRNARHPSRPPLPPIGSLAYFLPILREILNTPVDPAEISFLWLKMQGRL